MNDEAKLAPVVDDGRLTPSEIDRIVRESTRSSHGHLALIAEAAYEKARAHYGLREPGPDGGDQWLTARETVSVARQLADALEDICDEAANALAWERLEQASAKGRAIVRVFEGLLGGVAHA